jgi:hypothetical protein
MREPGLHQLNVPSTTGFRYTDEAVSFHRRQMAMQFR